MLQIPIVCLSIHPKGSNAAKWLRFKFPLWSLVSVVYRNYRLFDLDLALELAALECRAIPSCTTDCTSRRFFSRHFAREEIIRNRDRVAQRLQSTPGFDTATYKLFTALSVDALLRFFNLCLDLRSVPHAASCRLVGLESYLLKMFTLLWDDWFREWMEDEHILPDTQNGFRRGYHGLNNPFILRCAIETVLGFGHPLYVVLPDLTKAFPLTDHSSFWVMMYKHKGVPECRPGAPGREGGSSAGHEKIYMTPQNFKFFTSNSM
ncbi:hypothetical protein ARMGADRAFT_1001676 [Armillaria gallica]|uniref:Reverse transcriptase domain-containing protein n=1 Tax=Armillaria gallica TaxID=47427 RepID=A0A2H3D4A6_ARMGA|nr:hypothetical protein ARMGADRAFT_1001676 [Armillaria gallica]